MRIAILFSTLLLCSTAGAQISPERYYPLNPGDIRVYEHRGATGAGWADCSSLERVGYERNEVLRDTVVAGEVRSVASCTSLSATGNPTGRNVFVVGRISFPLDVQQELLTSDGGCRLAGGGYGDAFSSEDLDATVFIGGTSYTVAGALHNDPPDGTGSGGTSYSVEVTGFADIGIGETISSTRGLGYCRAGKRTLVYADVAGQVYGANPVASQDTPPPASGITISASPSLARRATSLSISTDSQSLVRLDAFNLLGQRVHSADVRPGTLRLDVSRWPAGLYIVRATADGDAVTTPLTVSR